MVVWVPSAESVREWHGKAKYEIYDDPAHRRIEDLPIKYESMTPLLLAAEARADGDKVGGLGLSVVVAIPKKKGKETSLQLSPDVEVLKRALEGYGKGRDREKPLERVKRRANEAVLSVRCFLRVFGLSGLERWAIARLSPRHRIAQSAMRLRAIRLYRASRRRQSTKDRASGRGTSRGR